jgi:NAD(P)-dependent dehydrogenase (short-subunit alcohol dehydrogenase family)
MDLQLTDKRAVVTGASKGIGRAVARALADEGCDVVLVARTPEPLQAAATEIADATGRTITAVPADTGSLSSVQVMVAAAVEVMGGVDILVNSAARPMGRPRRPSSPTSPTICSGTT